MDAVRSVGLRLTAAWIVGLALGLHSRAEDPVCPGSRQCNVQNSVGSTGNSSPCWVLPGSFVTVT